MPKYASVLAALIILTAPLDAGATVKCLRGWCFEANIISSGSLGDYGEFGGSSEGSLIQVREGQEYSIVVRNPMPVRVAAAVTVDGLNIIDGKRSTPADAQKWIIEPYSSITLRGWQTSDSNLRRFVFTRDSQSYAQWKGRRDHRDYSPNLGMIGVAFFWNSSELEMALRPQWPEIGTDEALSAEALKAAPSAGNTDALMRQRERAATGMGHNESNQVTRVNFYYDSGMYSPDEALIIHYEFHDHSPRPLPFDRPGWPYRYRQNYAPEMP
ncbi:MAG: hypothetical protein K1X79_08715 [Oligoflexia bacterium]|nr:hypothetical protein [Oligoflexia bacterium]